MYFIYPMTQILVLNNTNVIAHLFYLTVYTQPSHNSNTTSDMTPENTYIFYFAVRFPWHLSHYGHEATLLCFKVP